MIAKLELPALTTISKVEVTPDLKLGKIGITVLDNKDEKRILEILQEHIYEMQGELIRKLKMRIVPRISFVIDKSEEYASHINKLLRETKEDEPEH